MLLKGTLNNFSCISEEHLMSRIGDLNETVDSLARESGVVSARLEIIESQRVGM